MEFSANLGFLFPELPFPDRIGAAARAGFGAVEFHDQMTAHDPDLIAQRLEAEGLFLCAINCPMGETLGSAALLGQEARFREEFEATLAVAQRLNASAIHVLTGRSSLGASMDVLLGNLSYALSLADRPLLLEPLSPVAMPDYFLNHPDLFTEVINALPHPRLKLMADWYHFWQFYDEKAWSQLRGFANHIGHIQIARSFDRGDPFQADLPQWAALRNLARSCGLKAVGLEYRPSVHPASVVTSLRQGIM